MTRAERRITSLLKVASRPLAALEMTSATGLSAGRLYPALARLEGRGLILQLRDADPIPGTDLHRIRYRITPQC